MARFVETFKDWIVSFPNRYKIIEDGQEKTVEIERDWEPDVEGTSNNERVMNELVKNITYDTDTVHTTESGTSVYICDLVGMKEFTEYSSSDSSFIPKISAQINTTNSNQLSKIRFSGKDGSVINYDLYTINNGTYSLLGANKLKPNTIIVIKIVSNGANKIAVIQYLMDDKLDRGTYTKTASDLKTEIDGKVSKAGDTMTGTLNIKNSDKVRIALQNSTGEYQATFGFDESTNTLQLWNEKTGEKFNFGGTEGLKLPSNNFLNGESNVVDSINTNFNRNIGAIGKLTGTFPLTSAVKGNTYFLKSNSKVYICIEDYSGTSLTAPNANFEELSVYTNRLKLDNLSVFERVGDYTPGNTITLSKDFRSYKYMQIDMTITTGIIASFVTTTSNKIGRQLQFSTAAGETSNAAIALTFNSATTILTSNIRNTTLITLYLFN